MALSASGQWEAQWRHVLLEAGYTLAICDVNDAAAETIVAKGAKRVESPKAVADLAETVLVSPPTPDVVLQVALGQNGVVNGSALKEFIDLSMTGPAIAIRVAEALEKNEIEVLEWWG